MLRILTVLCLVGFSVSHMGSEYMEKYAYMKIMSSCVGEATVMGWKTEMRAASDKCKGQDVSQIMIDIQAMMKNMRKRLSAPDYNARYNMGKPVYVPVPVYVNQPQQQQQFPQYSQASSLFNFRTKRSMDSIDLSPEGIESMKNKMMEKISNMTCVLKEMNVLTADHQINYDHMLNKINELPVDERLKADFRDAMGMCQDFAMCMPFEKSNSPIKKELGTCMAFMKCMHKKKAMVCMRNDMRTYAPLMGYEGDLDTEEGLDMLDEITEMLTQGGMEM